jgi:SAM-dependent methyltransferase
MSVAKTENALEPLEKIMQRHGVRCTPSEFHAAVNVTFHEFESEVYDQEHEDMWQSLPREFERLASDCAPVLRAEGGIDLLDIGCGTGLATDCLLRSCLGEKIKSIDLIDTSRSMLAQAVKRAKTWNRPFGAYEGLLDALPNEKKYSLIVTCSVLHHVPDLAFFLRSIRNLQLAGGMYIHLQDPNGDHARDPEYLQRVAEMDRKKQLSKFTRRLTPRRVLKRISKLMHGDEDDTYCGKTNRELLKAGIIASPLSVAEIYSITDIHVLDGTGISIQRMKQWLTDYTLQSTRSYAFFGPLWSDLPEKLKKHEEELAEKKALNGRHIGATWKLE